MDSSSLRVSNKSLMVRKSSIIDFHMAQFELLSFAMKVEFPSIFIPFKNKYSDNQALIPLCETKVWLISVLMITKQG